MNALEKAITHIDDLKLLVDLNVHKIVSPDNLDVYMDLCNLIGVIKGDVLEQLKEQEPTHVDTVYSDDFGNVLLCECGCMWVGAANSRMNYCPGCGKELE